MVGVTAPVIDGSTAFSTLAPLKHVSCVPFDVNIAYVLLMLAIKVVAGWLGDKMSRLRPRKAALTLLVLLILLSQACSRPKMAPELTGMSLKEAAEEAADANYDLYIVGMDDRSQPSGTIVSQSPSPGELSNDWKINISIDSGSGPTEVPDVSGLCVAQATAVLTSWRLDSFTILNSYDFYVAGGYRAETYEPSYVRVERDGDIVDYLSVGHRVTGTDPPAGTRVDAGTKVDIETTKVFRDDFSDPSNGLWDIRRPTVDTYYHDGGYRINVKENGVTKEPVGQACEQESPTVRVEATVTKGKPNDTIFGVFCHMAGDFRSYYRMGVRPDGYATIEKVVDEPYESLVVKEPTESILLAEGYHRDAVEGREGTFHIRGECSVWSDTLTLYVNGHRVEEASLEQTEKYDPRWEAGWVGVWVGNKAENSLGSDVLFDDFVVSHGSLGLPRKDAVPPLGE